MLRYQVVGALSALATLVFHSPWLVDGHGYLKTPRSRNWYAHNIIDTNADINDCVGNSGCPAPEYCQHCLNAAPGGVCGQSTVHGYETQVTGSETYGVYLGKDGQPMPWRSQSGVYPAREVVNGQSTWVENVGGYPLEEFYYEGGNITIDSYLDTHHNGHMEIRACIVDDSDPASCTTPTEFVGNELTFLEDLRCCDCTADTGDSIGCQSHPKMPADPNYPERGMYAGGQGGGVKSFSFRYRLPDTIVGEKILLQWKYITANSCSPPGYAEYFALHPSLPDGYWTTGVSLCSYPFNDNGFRDSTNPEQFFNCAEISVLPSEPTVSPRPTPSPTTAKPTVSAKPTDAPVTSSPVSGPPPCLVEYADCTYNANSCCDGTVCTQYELGGLKRCLSNDMCNVPPPPPSPPSPSPPPPSPTPPPTPPTGGGDGCCSINLRDCHHDEGTFCDLNQENCEGPCGKLWISEPLTGCLALWESGCSVDYDCCQHGECRNGSCESDDPWNQSTTSSPTQSSAPSHPPTTAGPSPSPSKGPTDAPNTQVPTNAPTPPVPTKFPTPQPSASPITPQPTTSPVTASPTPEVSSFNSDYSTKVRVNQVGYLSSATKVGIIVDEATVPKAFQVQDSFSGSVVLSGTTAIYGADGASGDHVHQADFTALNILGTYKLVVDAIGGSLEFAIGSSLYPQLPHEAMNYFYFHRMGNIAIEGDHLIDDRYARAALHPDDNSVPPYPGWCSACTPFDLLGSWADAGDFGIYTVNHAISAWTLLNLHEMFPTAFVDGELNLPESANSFPDVLDEVDFGSRFVRGMLPSDGGLASHKAHNHAWSAFTITIAGENDENSDGTRSAMGSSTAATHAVARTNAQLARMWSKAGGDATHINTLWSAAKDAFNRAITNPVKYYSASEASPGSAVGGGDYPDGNVGDDLYAAACEMYLTAYTLSDENVENYKNYVTSSSYFRNMGGWDWASVAGAGTLSLYAVANDLDASDITSIEANIVNFADQIKMAIDNEGYPSNLNYPSEFGQYPWGSNSFIMNRMMVLAYAYEVTSENSYQDYLLRSMDYVMGTNAMDISYVTGYGEKAETDTHDRWAWTVGEDTFWPKGWLSGGPNNELINDSATPNGVAAAKSYAAPGTAPNAWGSKENTVNWNAPLAWVAWYIENKIVPNLGGCGEGNCAPLANSFSGKLQMDTNIALTLTASDYDGTIDVWEIVSSPSFGTLTGTLPDVIYTPNQGAIGTDSFTFQVQDNIGQVSNVATVSLTVRDCDLIDIFQVPSIWQSFGNGVTRQYNYVHVSEDGPNIGLMKQPAHQTQWDGSNLAQFTYEPEASPYYADLRSCMIQQLTGSAASFTLSGCGSIGVNGLDGEYWITSDVNENEIWVKKDNSWAMVFTNDASYSPEFCRSSEQSPGPSPAPTTAEPTPSPTIGPTDQPVTSGPTDQPVTSGPTNVPSPSPTMGPTDQPVTSSPTNVPSPGPVTDNPTEELTPNPTTPAPITAAPILPPNPLPTKNPTPLPTDFPITSPPTLNPTGQPVTDEPTPQPSDSPSKQPVTPLPSLPPSPPPTQLVTPPPTSEGIVCCADRNTGYQTCNTNNWCSKNANNCNTCGGVQTTVPMVPTGCCSWGGDCSGVDPSTNYGCHMLQADCEGSCNGSWQSF